MAAVKVVSENREARHRYDILETYECGIELKGTEVKSVRAGKVNLRDGFARFKDGELYLMNVHISPHETASAYFNHDPRRTRKLLMHRAELRKLIGKVEQKGLTLVPLKMYFKGDWVKVLLGLARGRKLHDKRQALKEREQKREIERALKQWD
ncbi:MAG: SsrA-binding protein SmpB [Gloeomargarita sp. GMQP_bins_120]